MSLDPEDAAANVKKAEEDVAAKEKALAEQKKAQKDAEDAAAKAKAKAEADPSAKNIQDAANASKEATDAANKTTEAAKARNEALGKANDARLEEVGAIVAAGNAKLHHSKMNPNGFHWSTDDNLDQFTPGHFLRLLLNNMIVRVTGGERKVVMGASLGVVIGAKNEVVMSMKSSFIFPLDGKIVTGANRNNFAGLKMDTIGGAKIDKVYGPKREVHIGPKVYKGPTTSTETPIKDFLVGAWKVLSTQVKNVASKHHVAVGSRTISGSKLLKDVQTLRLTTVNWVLQANKETNDLETLEVKAGKIEIKSTGLFKYKAKGTATLDGGGAKLVLGGSAELSKGGSITCDGGGVSVNGKTLVN